NRYLAEDALESVRVEYDPVEPVVDLEKATRAESPLVHMQVPRNICGTYTQSVGDVATALAKAPRVLRQRLRIDRGAAQPMETPAGLATFARDGLTVWSNTQLPHRLRAFLADRLEMPADDVRLIAPDVGGSFGCKADYYPEDLLVCLAARQLGRPVR